jgi:hypothetical protein
MVRGASDNTQNRPSAVEHQRIQRSSMQWASNLPSLTATTPRIRAATPQLFCRKRRCLRLGHDQHVNDFVNMTQCPTFHSSRQWNVNSCPHRQRGPVGGQALNDRMGLFGPAAVGPMSYATKWRILHGPIRRAACSPTPSFAPQIGRSTASPERDVRTAERPALLSGIASQATL